MVVVMMRSEKATDRICSCSSDGFTAPLLGMRMSFRRGCGSAAYVGGGGGGGGGAGLRKRCPRRGGWGGGVGGGGGWGGCLLAGFKHSSQRGRCGHLEFTNNFDHG